MRVSALGALVSLTVLGSACGTAQPTLLPLTLSPTAVIDNARSDYGGSITGLVWLKRHVRVKIGTATNPTKAESVVEITALAANFSDAPVEATLKLAGPVGAVLERKSSDPATTVTTVAGTIDPGTAAFAVTASVPAQGHFEFVARYKVAGTLVSDVRRIYESAPTAELLLSYHVPMDAVGSFGVIGADVRPIVTSKDGVRIIAVMMRNLPAANDKLRGAYARYITKRAKPKGYSQSYASSWKRMLGSYAKAFGEASKESRGGAATPPVTPKAQGLDGIKELTLWTRDRIQRDDAFERVPWVQPRSLPTIIPKNDLYAVDKVHLLHWLLEAAGIQHKIAVVRSNAYPPMSADLPTPGAFDGALIYVPGANMWLDPACKSCEPGQVSSRFQGQQAALLPAQSPALIRVPAP